MKKRAIYADSSAMRLIRLLIILICLAGCAAAIFFLSFVPIVMWICVGIFAALALFAGIIYIPLYFGSVKIEIDDSSVAVASGVFFHVHESMQLDAVQYVTLISVSRLHIRGGNFIILNAQGGKLFLPFINSSDASELYCELNAALGISVVSESVL